MSSLLGRQGFTSPTGLNPTSMTTGTMKEKIPSGYKKGSLQQFSPEQMQLFQQLFGHVGPESPLSRLASGDQSAFGEIEAPALRQFNELLGGISSRFTGDVGGGRQAALSGRRSSGFQNELSSASQQFAGQLQSNRQALQRQAILDLMGISKELLGQRPYENFLVKKPQSPWAGIFGQLAGAVPGLVSSFMGGGSAGSALKGASNIFSGGNSSSGIENQFRSGEAYLPNYR